MSIYTAEAKAKSSSGKPEKVGDMNDALDTMLNRFFEAKGIPAKDIFRKSYREGRAN